LAQFEVTNEDLTFLEKVSPVFNGKKYIVPPPTLCPNCRVQRRLAIRNERKLYRTQSSLSGGPIISLYSPDKPYIVYSQNEWWSDSWDAMEFRQEFDFSRSFFDQFRELADKVPRLPLYNIQEENADMCNFSGYNKDCYLIFGSDHNQNCYYDHWIFDCKDTLDSSFCYNSELLWDCVDCVHCYECQSCQDCETSKNCISCFDVKGCEYCFGCVGLRQKKYHIFNEPIEPSEYEEALANAKLDNSKLQALNASIPIRNIHAINSENYSGDFIVNSKNVFRSFDVRNSEGIRHSHDIFDNAKDCMDCAFTGNAQVCYESYEAKGFDVHFCNRVWPCTSSFYLDNCDNCSHCFGCCGIRRKEYCILNTQYTKEEYEELVPKIIDHMSNTAEWGEFYPASHSPFGYNETSAMDYFPLAKEEALAKGFRWHEGEEGIPDAEKTIRSDTLPDSINNVPDDILNWAIVCSATCRPFRVIKQELDFFRQHNISIPHFHPDERHQNRLKRRNPRSLYTRECAKCRAKVESTYAPDKPKIVYCEQCYLAEVY
tara:strand:- start:2924 stop:4552 length:1629 start_codon:yes stop_codon:yes gene_type:complete